MELIEVHPTRMELLAIRNKIKLAQRGLTSLKKKRDVLVMKFLGTLSRAKRLREELVISINSAYRELDLAKVSMGSLEVESITRSSENVMSTVVDTDNLMGVEIPKINLAGKRGFVGLTDHPMLISAEAEFIGVLEQIAVLVEVEGAMRRVAKEVKMTRRRVNAIEHVLLPELEATRRYIEFHLEELEHENFFRLKVIKRKLNA